MDAACFPAICSTVHLAWRETMRRPGGPLGVGCFRFRRTLVLCLVFLFGLVGLGRQAYASCSFSAGNTLTSTVALPAQLVVPRNVSLGTVLWDSGWVQGGSGTASILCNAYFYMKWQWNIPGLQPSGIANVYALPNLPGVGIRGSWYWGSTGSPEAWAYIGQPDWWTANSTQDFVLRSFLSVQLVAIGPIRNGTQTFNSPTISVWYDNINAAQLVLTQTSVKTLSLACVTPDVVVPMGKHMSSELAGRDTYSPSPTRFAIKLNDCPAGMDSIQYRVDPVTAVVNSGNSVVALDGSSTATGVGVQLLDGTGVAVLPLGTPISFHGYDQGTGGSYEIPLYARYYQTGDRVGAGKANTSVTFTMTYD